MKTNNLFLLILLFGLQSAIAQQYPREVLHGQIIADSVAVENVNVFNKSTNRFAVSDSEGYFNIFARENDTLVLSSMAFDSKRLVLAKKDFTVKILRIRLEVFVNALDEVVISPYALTGDLEKDHQNIKIPVMPKIDVQAALTMQFEGDAQSSPVNKLMPGYVDTSLMPNFMAIAKLFLNRKSRPREKKIIFTSSKIFPEAVKDKFSDGFLMTTLGLNKDEVGLFLAFCQNDPRAQSLLEAKREFELIDFLISKRKEYENVRKE